MHEPILVKIEFGNKGEPHTLQMYKGKELIQTAYAEGKLDHDATGEEIESWVKEVMSQNAEG